MSERYYSKDYDELYYIFDSHTVSEEAVDERIEYDDYNAFEDSLTDKEILKLLNEGDKEFELFQNIVWGTLHGYIKDYEEMLDKQEGMVLGNALKERLNALKDLNRAILNRWTEEILKDIPKQPIHNCRCVLFPLMEEKEDDPTEDD